MTEKRRAVNHVLRLEKQLAKGRMRHIIDRGRQDDFGYASRRRTATFWSFYSSQIHRLNHA